MGRTPRPHIAKLRISQCSIQEISFGENRLALYLDISSGLINRYSQIAAFQLAQAATIAIRYSVVREQGLMSSSVSGNKEVSLMSYQSQRYRLLTSMARAFSIVFASQVCDAIYQDLAVRQAQDDHSTLSYVHITTAALKAFATQVSNSIC